MLVFFNFTVESVCNYFTCDSWPMGSCLKCSHQARAHSIENISIGLVGCHGTVNAQKHVMNMLCLINSPTFYHKIVYRRKINKCMRRHIKKRVHRYCTREFWQKNFLRIYLRFLIKLTRNKQNEDNERSCQYSDTVMDSVSFQFHSVLMLLL